MLNPLTKINSVLLIDDDPDDLDLLNEALHDINPGISVRYLSNSIHMDTNSIGDVDLVLLDINMPIKDGFAWLGYMRENIKKDLTIVMYTNSQSPLHISRAYQEGADLYFPKPLTYYNLKDVLTNILKCNMSAPFFILP